MKKLLALITVSLLALSSAIADLPYATDMAIYQEITPPKPAYYYIYVRWHNIEFGHCYQLQQTLDGINWMPVFDFCNYCCMSTDIWVQETPITHPNALFRVQVIN